MHILWKDKRQIPWRASHGLNWENKAYKKLKSSIETSRRWVGHLLQDQPLKCWPRLVSEKGDPDPAFPLLFSRESRIPALFFTRIPYPELFSSAISNTFFFPNPYPCQILPNPASRVAFKSRMPPYILEKSQAREYPSRHCKAACVNTVQI